MKIVGKVMEKYRIYSRASARQTREEEGGGRVSLVLPHERARKVRDIQKSPGVIYIIRG